MHLYSDADLFVKLVVVLFTTLISQWISRDLMGKSV